MGRKSKLSEEKWSELGVRFFAGESGRSLAREYGVSEAAIRKRFGSQNKQIKIVANQLAEAEIEFKKLPIGSQISARTLADKLKSISEHLGSAAEYGAMTAHRLSQMAHTETNKIDDTNPLLDIETLKGISALTRMANESADLGISLINAQSKNQDAGDKTIKLINAPDDE